ncbi:hypothetical protein MOK15_03840 [Sphingobium sp. BYY-5]|uniref:hypothetical protein n=1 Tax=Sphingobium sp. BYY-5 TaxID=2926400 RepID=UPI001FA810AE|nr:hypothetical protein [Sphingobium sp. BYY-5]MCI4589233.1 hypothetical protein [Sphingobium sp. BYY-5]
MGRLIHINGAPGVGKLTVAQIMAQRLQARILDNHTIYNVGFALADFGTSAFFDVVRAVRTVAYERILELPDDETIIFTAADFDDSDWGRESWQAVEQLAVSRGWPLFTISLLCNPAEHRMRIVDEGRKGRGKLQDASAVDRLGQRPLIMRAGPLSMQLDTTGLTADRAAAQLTDWIEYIAALTASPEANF